MKALLCVVVALIFAPGQVRSAHRAGRAAGNTARFTSEYTDLTFGKGCNREFSEDESPEGSDIPLVCRGPGGYEVNISYAAVGAFVSVSTTDDSFSVQLADQSANFNEGRKIEWRLANGRPFAVILRVVKYRENYGDATEAYDARNKTGEVLLVRGLKGHEHIKFEVKALKNAEANIRARQMADKAFR